MIVQETAHNIIQKTVDYVLKYGTSRKVWGGTVPNEIGNDKSPNDFDREMIECEPITIKMTNPLARWCDLSDQWVGITLREFEDHMQGYNPGHVIKYSKLYPHWLKNGFFNYTYGERLFHYPYNLKEVSGMFKKVGFEYNQFFKVIELLKENPTTRKACISTWYPPADLGNNYCPCNALFQLRVVDGKLDWITTVRSLDVLRGFTENIFFFTAYQELAAMLVGVPIGNYYTVALNPHLYVDLIDKGYHKQKDLPDCYEYFKPSPLFESKFPYDDFRRIDYYTFVNDNPKIIEDILLDIETPWQQWKAALVCDWYRLQGDLDTARKFLKLADGVYRFSLVRRLAKKDKSFLEFLDWDKQRSYLEEHL